MKYTITVEDRPYVELAGGSKIASGVRVDIKPSPTGTAATEATVLVLRIQDLLASAGLSNTIDTGKTHRHDLRLTP